MEEKSEVAVLDKKGDILCFIKDEKGFPKISSKPLEEVSLEDMLIFWEKDIGKLHTYIYSLITSGITLDIDLENCSFLDLYIIDKEGGLFYLG